MAKRIFAAAVFVSLLAAFAPAPALAIEEGDRAPLFNAETLRGDQFNLKEMAGNKVVVLNFWSVFCRDCIMRIEAFNKLMDLYSKRNFALVGISGDPPTKRMLSLTKKYAARMHYDVIMDRDLDIFESYGAEIIPYVVLVDREGTVALVIDSLEPEPLKKLSAAIERLTAEP